MDVRAIHRLLREGNHLTGAFVGRPTGSDRELYRTLKNTPRVSGVTIKEASVRSFETTIAENLGTSASST